MASSETTDTVLLDLNNLIFQANLFDHPKP
jgi:hypothetical protein